MSDNSLSPLETSSMDFEDHSNSSTSSSTSDDDGSESGNISLSGLRAVCERRGPMRPQRTGYIPPARRSSTGTSAALLTEDDDESADDAGLTEADCINVAQRIMEKNPMVPLPESTTSSSQESLFSAVGHVSHGQSQRSPRLRTSTPGVTVGRESNLLSSSQLDVSAIPQASFSSSLPSSNEGLADESTREISSRNSNSRPQRPGSSFGVHRRLTFDGSSKSSEDGVVEHTESGLQSIAEENPLERSNTETLSFIEGGIIDEPIMPVDSLATTAIQPNKLQTFKGPNLQPVVAFTKNDREVAEAHKKKGLAASSSQRPGAAAPAAEDSPASESRFEVAKRFVRKRKTNTGSTQSLFPQKIGDPTPKRQSGAPSAAGKTNATVEDEGGRAEGGGGAGEEDKRKDRSRDFSDKSNSNSSSSPKDRSHRNVSRGGSIPVGQSGRNGDMSFKVGDHRKSSSGGDRITPGRTSRNGNARRERAGEVGGGGEVIPSSVDVRNLRRSHLETKSPRLSRRSLIEPRDSSSSDNESSLSRRRKSHSILTRDDNETKKDASRRGGSLMREAPREAQQSSSTKSSASATTSNASSSTSNGGEAGNEKTGRQTRGSKRRPTLNVARKSVVSSAGRNSQSSSNRSKITSDESRRHSKESTGSNRSVPPPTPPQPVGSPSVTRQTNLVSYSDSDHEGNEDEVSPVAASGMLYEQMDAPVGVADEHHSNSSSSSSSSDDVPEEPVASTSRGPRRSIAEEPVARTSKTRTGSRSKTAAAATPTASATTAKCGRKRGPKPPPPIPKKIEKVLQINNCITEHIVRCRLEALDMEMSNAKVRDVTAHLNLKFEEMLTELQSKTLRDQGMFSYRELEQALWNRDLLYRRPDGRSSELLVFFAHVLNHDDFKRCQKALLIPTGNSRDTEFI